ncbi:Elongation factor G 1 [Labeo rohita]|uniref:Elongation factor G 1 n=1 Tax=Labeo rohita TaxID=84645 RepID=A0ABQ8LYB3_LABRO|nr:Elongation factor G 1 [Labeo rohita]
MVDQRLYTHSSTTRSKCTTTEGYRGLCSTQSQEHREMLGSSFLALALVLHSGVLIRFRQHAVAISGDICTVSSAHAVRPSHFRSMSATISQSLPTEDEARQLVNKMRSVLGSGRFEIRQWASNFPSVVEHLPANTKSESIELWLQKNHSDPQEPALGLIWHCLDDHLGYKHHPTAECLPIMRHIYKVLASQYDPLRFVTPFTTRAKVLVHRLWAKPRGCDDPNLTTNLLERWKAWEQELPNLAKVMFPRCYIPSHFSEEGSRFSLHIFCDAAKVAYGAVAYLLIEHQGEIHTSFVMARSRVAPKRQLTMPVGTLYLLGWCPAC